MSIGIFDSGLGGLTVAKAVMEALPLAKIIYFGDTARTPYGNKSPEEVARFARENTEFLLRKKVQAIVVGCNTASAVAGQDLRRAFPGVPIFEVITPAVREALQVSRTGRIGVIGTRTTIESGAYQKWFPGNAAYHKMSDRTFCDRSVYARACPMFVPLVEAGRIMHPTTYEVAEQYLAPFKEVGVDTLILGCTHYPFLKPVIADIMGKSVKLVDSAETVAKELRQLKLSFVSTDKAKLWTSQPKHEFYVSKKTPRFQELAEKWLGQKITLKLAKI